MYRRQREVVRRWSVVVIRVMEHVIGVVNDIPDVRIIGFILEDIVPYLVITSPYF
jgi:hypothetical protein